MTSNLILSYHILKCHTLLDLPILTLLSSSKNKTHKATKCKHPYQLYSKHINTNYVHGKIFNFSYKMMNKEKKKKERNIINQYTHGKNLKRLL